MRACIYRIVIAVVLVFLTQAVVCFGEGGDIVWEFNTHQCVWRSPVVCGRYVYVPSFMVTFPWLGGWNYLYCLKARTGKKVWVRTMWDEAFTTPAVIYGKVYVSGYGSHGWGYDTPGGDVYCFNALTGRKLWEFEPAGESSSSLPAVAYGYVYVTSDKRLYCLDAETGDEVWSVKFDSYVHWPSVSGGYVYTSVYSAKGDTLYCFNAHTGAKRWEIMIEGHHFHGRAIDGDELYTLVIEIGGGSSYLLKLNTRTREKLWEVKVEDSDLVAGPSISNGYVYLGVIKEVWCIDGDTGDKVWEFEADDYTGAPIVTRDYVYVNATGRKFYCLDAWTGDEVWRFEREIGQDAPRFAVVSGGYVYVGASPMLYCLEAEEDEDGQWPMAGYNAGRTYARPGGTGD